ncbi:MAG: hypothetical protein LCH26_06205, partial [Proteobacteria bacterium]|nr:hypothetical protein [Pseudomonadota bacterium]
GWGWYQKSFDLMKTAAHAGESEAQYLTGLMLSQGLKDEAGGFWSQLGSLVGAGKTARMRADRPEAIHWLLRALKQKHPLAKDALLVLFENNVREGSATYAELMMLADGCDISKTSLYDSRNRWDAIDYYQKAARLAAQAHDFGREGEARYQAGVILNKPYLEGDKAHFQWKRMRDVAREHFSVAASLGHERAQLCLEALDIEQCLDAHLAVNAAAISVQQMCGFFPGDWNPMQAVGALPCVPTEPQTALM